MSSVFDQAFGLSQMILESVVSQGILMIDEIDSDTTNIYEAEPLLFLNSLSITQSNNVKLIFFDTPRASKRKGVNLYLLNDNGVVINKEINLEDPNYKFILTANILAYARLTNSILKEDGLILAVTTPEIYLIVRGAFEHFMGSDKFLGEIVYQSRSGGGSDSKYMSIDHEILIVLSKNPDTISKFQIQKTNSELQKYSLSDEISPYYWDTYIRKQARNYYPIKAPDGTILELDQDGNNISWLWREQTYLEKLKAKEVKFEKLNGKWKLYYKDRLKEFKILRSISLNATSLNEISPNVPNDLGGSDLLNSLGSKEIKSYNGDKPDYLKPSTFYKFIFSTFNISNELIIIPFNENGSALKALNDPIFSGYKLILNSSHEVINLLNWRIEQEGIKHKVSFKKNEILKLKDFFTNENINYTMVEKLVTIKFNILESWSDFKNERMNLSHSTKGDKLYLIIKKLNFENINELVVEVKKILKLFKLNEIIIFSEYNDNKLLNKLFIDSDSSKNYTYFEIPFGFLK